MAFDELNWTSRREEIVQEFIRRLSRVFPDSGMFRGFTSKEVTTYDRFYIFDLPESGDLGAERRGMYTCQFGISVSYWIKFDEEDKHTRGNLLLEKIRYAIELDERLRDTSRPDKVNLVTSYSMDEGALIWYDKGVLDVEILYIVEYQKDAGWVNNPFAK